MDCSWAKLKDLRLKGGTSKLIRRFNEKVKFRVQIEALSVNCRAADVNTDNAILQLQSIPEPVDVIMCNDNGTDMGEKHHVDQADTNNKDLTPKKIIGPVSSTPDGVIIFMVEWQEQDEMPGHITNEELKVRSPQVLIEFYQKNLSFD